MNHIKFETPKSQHSPQTNHCCCDDSGVLQYRNGGFDAMATPVSAHVTNVRLPNTTEARNGTSESDSDKSIYFCEHPQTNRN